MDEALLSCVACDHPATSHGASGCALCSCVNPLEELVDDGSDGADRDARNLSGSRD